MECTYPAILGVDLFPALNVKIQLGNNKCCDHAGTVNTQAGRTCKPASAPVVGRIFAARNVKTSGRSMFVFEGKVKAPIDLGRMVMVDAALEGSERLARGCGRVLDTVRNNWYVLVHMVNPVLKYA